MPEYPPVYSVGADKNLLSYKKYVGKVEFDAEANLFHGKVINLRDVITFEGSCVDELRQAFVDSVEDYLEFCARRGETPEKPFSGQFVLRIDPEIHRRLSLEAKKRDKSLNQFVADLLEKAIT